MFFILREIWELTLYQNALHFIVVSDIPWIFDLHASYRMVKK
ncbi:hypothetical protein SAMN05216419_100341 [Nitrosomonas cryotolerans]|uniref:Uncharacterized protein n=1 Tax=Nitrosomonas cryotolerans ATCC 49181 TaxID=1131553 RepID=A0A1N6J7N8_9PROT|nr:hypothetical protein SAMN05216419_100341 [Nitrosomonas cryotolerans]SIO40340.1 hypothetical protein SAMN02743940_2377 [Nitrosomonas cryotolerans ATCC 49181]